MDKKIKDIIDEKVLHNVLQVISIELDKLRHKILMGKLDMHEVTEQLTELIIKTKVHKQ